MPNMIRSFSKKQIIKIPLSEHTNSQQVSCWYNKLHEKMRKRNIWMVSFEPLKSDTNFFVKALQTHCGTADTADILKTINFR